ncbi:hypothetical protein K492DRAFT_191207 [Lichtheimia hyalospora FSU 10163]|nr:hypothetical protein K492DRAFT_191207 [Lichtheimia hyalospora FSU 10163]
MQWRPLILLFSGFAVIYLASLLQETPYPHPLKVFTSDTTRWRHAPNEAILTTAGDYLYLTAIRYKVEPSGFHGLRHGTGELKTGVIGHIAQIRRPISDLVQDYANDSTEEHGWMQTFQHDLPGAISKVSQAITTQDGSNQLQFGVMYHVVENETTRHYVRIYYLRDGDDGVSPLFEYKDIRMPGTTWINAFSLEENGILFARDPDQYGFRMAQLPFDLTMAPHSADSEEIVIHESVPGVSITEYNQPRHIESHHRGLCRVLSPVGDTYRVISLDIYKTENAYHYNMTLADNSTKDDGWHIIDHKHQASQVYSEDQIDYIGFADVSQFQQQNQRWHVPQPLFSRSNNGRSIVFPYVQTMAVTLDYVDHRMNEKTNESSEYYSWLNNDIPAPYDASIMGMSINQEGNLLAVWSDYNTIYIYKRGSANNTPIIPRRSPSFLDRIDQWLAIADMDTKEESVGTKQTHQGHQVAPPPEWKLRMAITRVEGHLGLNPVSAVKFWNSTTKDRQRNYIFVALAGGGVNSYMIDQSEDFEDANFWTYLKRNWNMVTAMTMIIAGFVYNEYRNHSV